jgi:hypothetical protein
MKRNVFAAAVIFTLLSMWVPWSVYGDEAAEQPLKEWLVLGPAQIPTLEKDALGSNKSILNYKHLNMSDLSPAAGGKVPWSPDRILRWSPLKHNEFKAYETGALYLATYLTPQRWMETTLHVHNTNLGM